MKYNVEFDDNRIEKHYDIAWRSGIGKREYQQDSAYYAVDDQIVFAVICDGMGGMSGGELASTVAVQAYTEYCLNRDCEYFDGSLMQEAVESVDDIVYSLSDDEGKRLGAGSTLVSVVIQENWMYWLSVGDSRVYIFRGQEMVQITNDHNYFMRLDDQLEKGEITPEKYERESRKGEALISFIGMGGLMLIDVNEDAFLLMPGDTILLCTDGMYRTVPEADVHNIVSSSKNMEEAANCIERQIQSRGYKWQDNYTYILIQVK